MAIRIRFLKTALEVVVILLLTTGNGWAVASFAKKYGMGCKSCHTFGSELNDLGLIFKKNGHTFGEKNASQKDKPKQGVPRDDKITNSEASGKSPDKSESKTGGAESAAEASDAEQPLPETRVYSWKADDGTMHFSDTPYVNQRGEKKAASDKAGKKIVRGGFKPLSAVIPKRLQKTVAQSAAPNPEKTLLPRADSQEPKVTVEIRPEGQPRSFEDCMERILVANPLPNTSEAAMELFREAETICFPYENKQKR